MEGSLPGGTALMITVPPAPGKYDFEACCRGYISTIGYENWGFVPTIILHIQYLFQSPGATIAVLIIDYHKAHFMQYFDISITCFTNEIANIFFKISTKSGAENGRFQVICIEIYCCSKINQLNILTEVDNTVKSQWIGLLDIIQMPGLLNTMIVHKKRHLQHKDKV